MKVKLKNMTGGGYKQLVVDDAAINAKYGATQADPLVLASMQEFFNTGCWAVLDWRLSQHRREPSKYLESGPCVYEVKHPEEKDMITSELHTYELDSEGGGQQICWYTWDVNCWDGDNPSCKSTTGETMAQVARFTYKGAKERINEIRAFWEKFEGAELDVGTKIENPYRQPSEGYFFGLRARLEEEKKALKKANTVPSSKKKKP